MGWIVLIGIIALILLIDVSALDMTTNWIEEPAEWGVRFFCPHCGMESERPYGCCPHCGKKV